MTTYPTDMHGPFSEARVQTNEVAHCNVCKFQWQVRSPNRDDAKGCPFCGAPERAISIQSEAPGFGGATIYD